MNNIKSVVDIISSIFSNDGYKLNSFTIKCKSPILISIETSEDNISIHFKDSLPNASIKRLITMSVSVQAIVLGKNSGILKLKHFPDISFNYDEQEKAFGIIRFDLIDSENILKEINSKYDDDARKKIATKCLHYANEWATIVSQTGLDPRAKTATEKRILKKQCEQFIYSSIKNDSELKYGSAVLTFIVIYVILPVIIRWIVERALRNWFN